MTGVRLGVLMQRWPSLEQPFGPLTPFAQIVSILGRAEGLQVLLFGPEDIDFRCNRLLGCEYLGPTRGWTAFESPLPNVVWNRYFKRDQDQILDRLRRTGIPWLNERNPNKWEAYQLLKRCPRKIRDHLPETVLLSTGRDVIHLLERYPVVYLKPIDGSVGRGIIRCVCEGAPVTRMQYVSTETGTMRETYVTSDQLDRWIERKGRHGRYIVQQGLQLGVFHGRPADVRVLVQKDGSGQWSMTGMGARVAAHGRFTANLHTGGHGVPVELLTEAVIPHDPKRRTVLLSTMESLALEGARAVEEHMGPMGEIGLDFGVDGDGAIWYIEPNAQPGRSIFEHLGRRDLFELAHVRPIQYARLLATRKVARAASVQST